ncbi:helix-turn-helix domain-containing protein [Nocardia sp. CA-129566]|uniref:helix-turn-helix domain-containing protein n=1 Tax=Nocardia sp. CA-129566 TaxID=3239976 RepID=UPI003D98BF70
MATGSTFPARMLGRQLRRLRNEAGIAKTDAEKALGVSANTIWRIESGQSTRLSRPQVRELCDLYNAEPDIRDVLFELVGELGKPGWWHAYGGAYERRFDMYLALEEAADRLTTFQLTLLPGLVQTRDYRRAVMWAAYPQMSQYEVERRVELAARRQLRLQDPRLTMEVLLSESALLHHVGGRAVMADQLRHLARLSEQVNVSVRVVPLTVCHIGLQTGPFVLLEFPKHKRDGWSEPPVVYVESYMGARYMETDEEIGQYRIGSDEIRRVALDAEASRRLFLERTEEFE